MALNIDSIDDNTVFAVFTPDRQVLATVSSNTPEGETFWQGVLPASGDYSVEVASTGGTAAVDLMGGRPAELPDEYRLADPMSAVPLPVPVLCVHARADENVPFAQSADYVAAAHRAGGRAELLEIDGDHFTVVDPSAPAWRLVVTALPRLLGR